VKTHRNWGNRGRSNLGFCAYCDRFCHDRPPSLAGAHRPLAQGPTERRNDGDPGLVGHPHRLRCLGRSTRLQGPFDPMDRDAMTLCLDSSAVNGAITIPRIPDCDTMNAAVLRLSNDDPLRCMSPVEPLTDMLSRFCDVCFMLLWVYTLVNRYRCYCTPSAVLLLFRIKEDLIVSPLSISRRSIASRIPDQRFAFSPLVTSD
jgi:hypothetical protein